VEFLQQTTRNLFFTGKGGVGKTSVACATAVRLADTGKRVLLVSTDPASNLDEVLGTPLGHHPTPVPSIPNLFAMNLDPEKSAAEYRERMVGPYRTLKVPIVSSCSIRRRRVIPFCCWILLWHIIARSLDRRRRCLKPCRTCCHGCEILSLLAC
jgi:hypothetical protein